MYCRIGTESGKSVPAGLFDDTCVCVCVCVRVCVCVCVCVHDWVYIHTQIFYIKNMSSPDWLYIINLVTASFQSIDESHYSPQIMSNTVWLDRIYSHSLLWAIFQIDCLREVKSHILMALFSKFVDEKLKNKIEFHIYLWLLKCKLKTVYYLYNSFSSCMMN